MPSLRFYVTDLTQGLVRLDEDESQHARKAMRVAAGDAVELFDGAGGVAAGKVAEVGRVVAIEVSQRRSIPRLTPEIDVAVAIPKGDRAAVLVEKASELGADRLIPLVTQRSVVDPGGGKLDRLRRIALEAAKQCGRAWLMEVAEPIEFGRFIAEADHEVKLIADTERAEALKEIAMPESTARIAVMVGPEGGWTPDERLAAREAGFHALRLGPHVMRIETAALAALAILRQGA